MRAATRAVHAGQPGGKNAPLAAPIHVGSAYSWESFEDEPEFVYSRYSHANRTMLEEAVASLEGAKHAVGFGSGMAAMHGALSLAQAGEHVLIASEIYGGTAKLGRWLLPRNGIEVSTFNSLQVESLEASVQPNTRVVVFESPTNPLLHIADLRSLCEFARSRGVLTVVDNTFATPLLQNPLELGADVVMHSTTKYLGGHSDVVGGVLATNDAALHDHFLKFAMAAGGIPGPFDCWLVCRGLRTLVPRMRMQCDNAMEVAKFLSAHPKVERVYYPGLPDAEGHALARSQMRGYGAMLSFEVLGGRAAAIIVSKNCELFKLAGSLGSVESSLSYPPVLSHVMLSPEELAEIGIGPGLLRASIGIEDPEDLIEDLDRALGYA